MGKTRPHCPAGHSGFSFGASSWRRLKYRWLVDEEAAAVVRRIYRLTIEGYGPYDIARILYEDHVETPAVYAAKQGKGVWKAKKEFPNPYNWSGYIVGQILSKPEYKLTDERFTKMTAKYETEQKDLEQVIASCEEELREAGKAKVDLQMLLKGLREFTELRELTPAIVNTVIQRVEVHNSDHSSGHIRVKVDIYFTAVGMVDLPTEEEIKAMKAEIMSNPQQYKVSA